MVFLVVTYDIADDKRRAHIARELLNFGTRVQESVFECELEDNQVAEVKKRLQKIINTVEDSLRYYPLCNACRKKIEMDGTGVSNCNPDYFLI